jgi:DNA (cytosine-5)-methyltransferase 1
MKKQFIDPEFIVIDLFCGAGGVTTGFTMTDKAIVIACINHDHMAIKSHWENHQEVEHFEEDITTFYGTLKYGVFFKSDQLKRLKRLVDIYKAFYPDAKLILWASLECTNFSKAKGGQARDADSRTLADHLQFYIYPLRPDIIQIENVVEFMSWGPLDQNGKPINKKNGSDWLRWRKEICSFGYQDEWKELNSADFGAYTSRNRLFGIFAFDSSLITWPEPTHSKKPSTGSMFTPQKKWMPVKEVLDLQDEGNSIFNRKKDLSPKTLERIYAGLIKYVANGEKEFIAKYYSGKPEGKVISVNGPAGTVKCVDGQSLIKTNFLLKYNSTSKKGVHIPPSINEPCPVVACQNRLGLATSVFLSKYHGNGANARSIEDPAPTLDCGDRIAKVHTVNWIDKQYGSGTKHSSIESPAGSLPTVPKQNLATIKKFIMNTSYNNVGSSLDEPSKSLLASRRHYYLVNPAWGGNNGSIENPCCVIVARQDKAPLYMVAVEKGKITIPVYDNDVEIMIKIKEFMVLLEIVDIKMRMLKVPELLKIQGFPNDYKLLGNQTDQKKFIGNSVVPLVVKNWIEAISETLKVAA